MYKTFVSEWHCRIIENENRPKLKKYTRMQRIQVEQCDAAYIRYWNLNVLKIRRITKKEKFNNIRRLFIML